MIRDIRGKEFREADPVKDFGLSQSEIIMTLRGVLHTHRPYSMEQLIHDIEALTPAHLDTWAVRERRDLS